MAGEGKGYSGPGEEHLEKLGKFVADHESDLQVLEHILDVASTEVWDPHSDGVGIKKFLTTRGGLVKDSLHACARKGGRCFVVSRRSSRE
jgi:hypothetical protein